MGVVSKPLIIDNIFFKTECLALNKSTRGPDLPQYCLNCTKFGKLIARKIIKIAAAAHQMSYFKAKMHEIRFRMELRPTPRLQRSLRPLAGFKGAYL